MKTLNVVYIAYPVNTGKSIRI